MACLMKRTPCCKAISPSSCGSMMTKRDLSYSKCRSINGKVPLPIEPKPIMTIGPEIFAWICGDGLMNCLRGIDVLRVLGIRSGGASLRGHLDLDLHLGLQKPGDDQDRRCRSDIAKRFAADSEDCIRAACLRDVIGRADDVGQGKTAILQRGLDGLEAVSCLARGICRHGHGRVIVAGGARDEGEIAVDDGTAIAGRLFERRA